MPRKNISFNVLFLVLLLPAIAGCLWDSGEGSVIDEISAYEECRELSKRDYRTCKVPHVTNEVNAPPMTESPSIAPTAEALETGVTGFWKIAFATPSDEVFTSLSHLPATIGGDEFHDFSVVGLHNAGPRALDVQVRASFDGYATDFDQSVALEAGGAATLTVNPAWNDKVVNLQSARPVTLKLSVIETQTGRSLYTESRNYQLLPPTYFAWKLDGVDMRPFSGIYVTPNADFVSDVLSDAAARTPWGSIVGYKEIPGYEQRQITGYQMKAVWDALQERGFNYVSAPEAYTTTLAQHIKFPSETYDDRSGNCIESVVLLASLFEAMGFHTRLIFIPGHAWLAVDVWSDNATIIAIESTMLPSADFDGALKQGGAQYTAHKDADDFLIVSLTAMRREGISPNPWFA